MKGEKTLALGIWLLTQILTKAKGNVSPFAFALLLVEAQMLFERS